MLKDRRTVNSNSTHITLLSSILYYSPLAWYSSCPWDKFHPAVVISLISYWDFQFCESKLAPTMKELSWAQNGWIQLVTLKWHSTALSLVQLEQNQRWMHVKANQAILMLFLLNNSTQTKKFSLLVTFNDIVRYKNLRQ